MLYISLALLLMGMAETRPQQTQWTSKSSWAGNDGSAFGGSSFMTSQGGVANRFGGNNGFASQSASSSGSAFGSTSGIGTSNSAFNAIVQQQFNNAANNVGVQNRFDNRNLVPSTNFQQNTPQFHQNTPQFQQNTPQFHQTSFSTNTRSGFNTGLASSSAIQHQFNAIASKVFVNSGN